MKELPEIITESPEEASLNKNTSWSYLPKIKKIDEDQEYKKYLPTI